MIWNCIDSEIYAGNGKRSRFNWIYQKKDHWILKCFLYRYTASNPYNIGLLLAHRRKFCAGESYTAAKYALEQAVAAAKDAVHKIKVLHTE